MVRLCAIKGEAALGFLAQDSDKVRIDLLPAHPTSLGAIVEKSVFATVPIIWLLRGGLHITPMTIYKSDVPPSQGRTLMPITILKRRGGRTGNLFRPTPATERITVR